MHEMNNGKMNDLIKVKDIPGKGKGVVALKSLKAGICILREFSLFYLPSGNKDTKPARILSAFNDLPLHTQKEYLDLHAWESTSCIISPGWEQRPAHEKKIISIFYCNNWGGRVFCTASRFNHECVPILEAKIAADTSFQAVLMRDVEAGDELTVTYIWDEKRIGTRERRCELNKWGFECVCPACVAGAVVAGDDVVG